MKKNDLKKVAIITTGVLTCTFVVLHVIGKRKKKIDSKSIDIDNQYLNSADENKEVRQVNGQSVEAEKWINHGKQLHLMD